MDVPVKWRGPTFDFANCGNPSGVLFIYDALRRKVEKGLANEILVDKEIEVVKGNGSRSTILNDEVTRLDNRDRARISVEDLGNTWKYSLTYLPDVDPAKNQPLDQDSELIEYAKYSKDKMGFSPHR